MRYLILLDEAHERRPLDLDRLAVSVVQCDHEVEKITFPQITRRLLLEVRPAHADPAINQTSHFVRGISYPRSSDQVESSKVSNVALINERGL